MKYASLLPRRLRRVLLRNWPARIAILVLFSIPIIALAASASSVAVDDIDVSSITSNSGSISISTHLLFSPNAGLSLSGPDGAFATSSSMIASGFFGDGSTLAGLAKLTSTQSFSGTNIFTSSFVVRSQGREIWISTSGTVANILISTQGITSFYPELHNTSSTILPEFSTTVSTYGPCVTGSTLTITTTGGRVEVHFTGDILASTSTAARPGVNFLLDGNFVSPLDHRKGFPFEGTFSSGYTYTLGFDFLTEVLPPGAHSFCLTLANLTSNFSVTLLNRSNPFQTYAGNIFYLKEIK